MLFSKPRTETSYSYRPSRLARSLSQWELGDGGQQAGGGVAGVGIRETSPRSQHSSSWDLVRPQTMSSSGSNSFSSPPPYHVILMSVQLSCFMIGDFFRISQPGNTDTFTDSIQQYFFPDWIILFVIGDGKRSEKNGIWRTELTFPIRPLLCQTMPVL